MRGEASRGYVDGMVLAVLEAGPQHGYAIYEELQARGCGKIELTPGNVYPALRRMERAGVLRSTGPAKDQWQRRIFELTRASRPALDAERARWRDFAAAVTAVLNPPPSDDKADLTRFDGHPSSAGSLREERPTTDSVAREKPRPRRSFTSEFKAEIVELCQRGDRSVGQVARDFDLTETAVREWVKQAERDTETRVDGGLTHAERQELLQLRRECIRLREDVEILKRAMGFFAKGTP